MPGLPKVWLKGPVSVVADGANPSTVTLWNCLAPHTQVTVPPARMVTMAGAKVSASAPTVALGGAPAGCVGDGDGGALVGGTAVAALGVGGIAGGLVAAVALDWGVGVAGDSAGRGVEAVAVDGTDAESGVVAAKAGVTADGAVMTLGLVSEPAQATRATAPMAMTSVVGVFKWMLREARQGSHREWIMVPMFASRTLRACDRGWEEAVAVERRLGKGPSWEGPFPTCEYRYVSGE